MARVLVPSWNVDTQSCIRLRTPLAALNLDVLAAISAHVAPDDMLAWRLTSKTLATVAESYRYCKLFFHTATHIRDACSLMAREPRYARCLKSLVVYEECLGDEVDDWEELMALVAGLVRSAMGLHMMRVENAERWLGEDAFFDALIACTQLEQLELEQNAGEIGSLWDNTIAFFGRLRAPVRVIKLNSLSEFPVHIFALLEHVAPTLEELDMSLVDIEPWPPHDSSFAPAPPTVFPRLHTLRMKDGSYVHVPTLEKASPALRALQIELDDAHHDQLSEYISDNRKHALSHWRRLDVLEGDIGGLWSLALDEAQVDLLSVGSSPRNALDAAVLAEILRGVAPEMLRLSVRPNDEAGHMFIDAEHLVPSVRVLELQVSSWVVNSSRDLFPSSSMEATMALLNALPQRLSHKHLLSSLRIFVDDNYPPRSCTLAFVGDMRAAQAALAQQFFNSITSLSVVTIGWASAGWSTTSFRRVDFALPAGAGTRTLCFVDRHTMAVLGRLSIDSVHQCCAEHRVGFFDALLVPRVVNLATDPIWTRLLPQMDEDEIHQGLQQLLRMLETLDG